MTDRRRSDEDRTRPQTPGSGAAGSAAGDTDDDVVEAEILDDDVVDAEIIDAEVVDDRAGPTPAPVAGEPADEPARDPDDDADDELAAAAAAVEVDLEMLLAEREQFLRAYQRTQADYENFRKQVQKRQDEAVQRALGGFVHGLLPVLDACDAAIAHGAGDAVGPVVAALQTALEKEGLERIDPVGKPFDPAEAEAVIHEPGDGGEQVVAETMRTGYRWRGRVLRPAMVKVTD